MQKKITAASLAAMLALCGIFGGCGKKNIEESGIENEFGKGEITYPIKTDKEVSYWVWLNSNILKSCSSWSETKYAEDLEKQTGIKVKYIHPAIGQEDASFNILFSSDDLPDIICNAAWRTFSGGGPDGAIDSGYIFDLTDYLKDYAPNYYKTLKSNPDWDKAAKSLNGRYYDIGSIGHDVPVYGMIIRKDWLEDLGLSMPETVQEWHDVLKAFKEKKGASAPLSFSASSFYKMDILESAYKTSTSFYPDGGKIKYGPLDKSYKEFVKEMAKWYKEGLLDKNMASTDSKALDAKVLNDNTGATYGYVSSGIGKWMSAKKAGSKMRLVAAPYPVLNKGDKPSQYSKSVSRYNNFAAISSTSKNKEIAMRLLDYGYSEKGSLLANYGREGVTYNIVDGKPQFTDEILHNPEGKSISEALYYYSQLGPFYLTRESFLQQITMPEQLEATKTWEVDHTHAMPNTLMPDSDQKEYADIMLSVESYVSETVLGVICGEKPESELDKMDSQLKKLNLDRAIEIQQKAYDNYNKE